MYKKVWIIGKSGTVATSLSKICDQKKIPYVATSRVECNILDKSEIEAFLDHNPIDLIINTAAYTAVDLAEKNKEEAYALNVVAVQYLVDLAKIREIKLIHYSTDYVFDGLKNTPYLETDRPVALSVYGKTKLLSEEYVLNHLKTAAVIRTSWVFGLKGHSFVKAMIKLMLKEKEIQVVTDQMSRPTYGEDLAWATLLTRDLCGLYHFANKNILSRFEYALMILEHLKKVTPQISCQHIAPIVTTFHEGVAQRPSYSALDTSKLESALQIKIQPINEPLKRVIIQCLSEIKYGI